jgi:hypothetical protein
LKRKSTKPPEAVSPMCVICMPYCISCELGEGKAIAFGSACVFGGTLLEAAFCASWVAQAPRTNGNATNHAMNLKLAFVTVLLLRKISE